MDLNLVGILALPIYSILFYYVLYQSLILKKDCKYKFILCLTVSVCFQLAIRFCLLSGIHWIEEFNVAKLLTILMVILLLFWGGSYVYGGWVRIGIYLIITEIVFSISARAYWLLWGYLNHASPEEIVMRARVITLDFATGLNLLIDAGLVLLLLIPLKKLRKYPIRPIKLAKAAVIAYLIVGSMPFIKRVGFDGGNAIPMFIHIAAFIFVLFFGIIFAQNSLEKERKHMICLKQCVFEEQAEILSSYRKKVQRLRHDLRRHKDALYFLLQEYPELRADESFMMYLQELRQYENEFKHSEWCEDEEFNLSMMQLDRYCTQYHIPVEIGLRRMRFSNWKQGDRLLFGTLLYNILLSFAPDAVALVSLSGDCLQGQNILQFRIDRKSNTVLPGATQEKISAHDNHLQMYRKDIESILSGYGGNVISSEAEQGVSYKMFWED